MKLFAKKWLILWACMLTGFAHGQSYKYRQFSTQEGLPSSTVYDVIQDHKGYMWFASENGLSRFDGHTFQNFTVKDGLTDNEVISLFEDRTGRIWCFTMNGRLCYLKNDSFFNPTNTALLAKLPDFGVVYSYFEDDSGTIFLSNLFHVLKIGRNTFEVKEIFNTNAIPAAPVWDGVSLFSTRRVVAAQNAKVVSYGSDGIKEISSSGQRMILPITSFPGHIGIPILSNPQTQRKIGNDFWLCTNNQGAIRIANFAGPAPAFSRLLTGTQVNKVMQDNEGNMWFCTADKGVFMIPDFHNAPQHFRKSDGLESEDVRAIAADEFGNIWAGSVQNQLYVIHHHQLFSFRLKSSFLHRTWDIYDMAYAPSGYLYLISTSDLYRIKADEQFFKNNQINPVIEPVKSANRKRANYKSISIGEGEKIFVCSPHQVIEFNDFRRASGYTSHLSVTYSHSLRNYCLHYDSRGVLWVANQNGLHTLENGRLIPRYSSSPLLKEVITKITELNDGNLLIATHSRGLLLFNGKKVIQHFTEENGLASDICNKITLYKDQAWIATTGGVSKLQYTNGRLIHVANFTVEDGLLSNEVTDIALFNDSVFVGSADGISILNQRRNVRSPSPRVYFTSITFGNKKGSMEGKFEVERFNFPLRIGFVAITYQQPDKIKYEYRLSGVDSGWHQAQTGFVDYPILPPGNYRFELRARKYNSSWSEIKSVVFEVTAPFWMQNWFTTFLYCLGLFASMITGYLILRRKRKVKMEKMEIRNRMLHLEQQALSALMNPHFIFNALNSVQHYLQQNDRYTANKYLTLFARLTRKNMEAVMCRTVTLEDELERLNMYLLFEKLRFGDKLSYQLRIAEEVMTGEMYLPPMILQPYVENAIWHGLMPKTDGGTVEVTVQNLTSDSYEIQISDNGIGLEKSQGNSDRTAHNSKGLHITRERLLLWTKGLGKTFSIETDQAFPDQTENPGVRVRIILPRVEEE